MYLPFIPTEKIQERKITIVIVQVIVLIYHFTKKVHKFNVPRHSLSASGFINKYNSLVVVELISKLSHKIIFFCSLLLFVVLLEYSSSSCGPASQSRVSIPTNRMTGKVLFLFVRGNHYRVSWKTFTRKSKIIL